MDKKVKKLIGRGNSGELLEVTTYDIHGNVTHTDIVLDKNCGFGVRNVIYNEHDDIIMEEVSMGTYEYGYSCDYEYDENDRIIKKITSGSSAGIEVYKYDKEGKLIRTGCENGIYIHYTYDTHGNIIKELRGPMYTIYEYDENDNIIHQIVTMITETGDTTGFEYWQEFDSANNITHYISDELESWYVYDENNNLLYEKNVFTDPKEKNNEINCKYNSDNELICKVTKFDNEEPETVNYTYEYY